MSIIKAADMQGRIGVHGLILGGQPKRSAPMPVRDPLQDEIEALSEKAEGLSLRLAHTETELASQREAMAQVRAEALAEGRAAGLAEAETREDARLKALELGLAKARAEATARLEALEPLAALLAREGLDKILGDPGAYPDLVERIVRRQIAGLKERSVLAVEVSAQDFPDREALERVGAGLAPSTVVESNDRLAGGECHLRLKLGGVDVGVRRQWDALGRLLGELALEGGSA
jgi:type III secretion protein L